MTVTKEKNGEVLKVAISGELDIKTAPELKAELDGELDDVTEIYFDLKDCPYTSSAGLRVFLGAYQVLDEKDGRIVLQNVNDLFKGILEETGFADFLERE
jgi:anti-sigma B factor antagonist